MTPSQNKAAMQMHIPQWQASQLSQAEYCKHHDIKPHIFSYYKKQFSSTHSANNAEQPSPAFVPVHLLAEASLEDAYLPPPDLMPIKITHSNGFSVDVPVDAALSRLKSVLELVRFLS